MAIKGSFSVVLGGAPLTATAIIPNAYMRLSVVKVLNEYTTQGQPAITSNVRKVTGNLDIFALATDAAAGIPPLASHEYSCAHVMGADPTLELYSSIMARPEFIGSVAT